MLRQIRRAVLTAVLLVLAFATPHWLIPTNSVYWPTSYFARSVVAFASTEYARAFTLTGAAAQRVSTIVAANGYAGSVSVLEMTVCNPAAANLYAGKSDVSASNGFRLLPGECYTWRSSSATDFIDISQMYLYVAADQTVQFTIRGK